MKLDTGVASACLIPGPIGPGPRWLPGAIAFGTSMLPFFRPTDEVWSEPVEAKAIRPGDLVTVSTPARTLFTHRVVKIAHRDGSLVFITKGDNSLGLDPPIFPDQIVGKVTRVGNKELTHFFWRWLGATAAWASYLQAFSFSLLARSWPNRVRHFLERKNLFPRIPLRGCFVVLSNPLSWVQGNLAVRWMRGIPFRFYFALRGIHIRSQVSAEGLLLYRWAALRGSQRLEELKAEIRNGSSGRTAFLEVSGERKTTFLPLAGLLLDAALWTIKRKGIHRVVGGPFPFVPESEEFHISSWGMLLAQRGFRPIHPQGESLWMEAWLP